MQAHGEIKRTVWGEPMSPHSKKKPLKPKLTDYRLVTQPMINISISSFHFEPVFCHLHRYTENYKAS